MRDLALRLEPADWRIVLDLVVRTDGFPRQVVLDLVGRPQAEAVDWTVAGLLFDKDPNGDPIVPADAIATEVSMWRDAYEDLVTSHGPDSPPDGSGPPPEDPRPQTDGPRPSTNGSGAPSNWMDVCNRLLDALARLRTERRKEVEDIRNRSPRYGVGVGSLTHLPAIRSWAAGEPTSNQGARRADDDDVEGSGTEWYGTDPMLRFELEQGLDALGYGSEIRWGVTADWLGYRLDALDVPGDPARHDVTVLFWRRLPQWWADEIDPRDYPSVFTSNTRQRLHDNGWSGLCLWLPFDSLDPRDPVYEGWSRSDGLLSLFEITRRHLFLELHRHCTGGDFGGEWLGPEAPHGLPPDVARRLSA